jgi:hypothetical protein
MGKKHESSGGATAAAEADDDDDNKDRNVPSQSQARVGIVTVKVRGVILMMPQERRKRILKTCMFL